MSTTTIRFDEKTERLVEELKKEFSATSKTELLRKALALLELARQARRKDRELAIVPSDTKAEGIQRIVFP